MNWTDEALQQMLTLLGEGHSTAEVGRRLGCSKGAVIGKARRNGWEGRPSPIIRDGREPKPKHKNYHPMSRATRQDAVRLPELASITVKASSLDERRAAQLSRSSVMTQVAPVVETAPVYSREPCCFPLWADKPTHQYCGAKARLGRPYCDEHCRVAYSHANPDPRRNGYWVAPIGINRTLDRREIEELAAAP